VRIKVLIDGKWNFKSSSSCCCFFSVKAWCILMPTCGVKKRKYSEIPIENVRSKGKKTKKNMPVSRVCHT